MMFRNGAFVGGVDDIECDSRRNIKGREIFVSSLCTSFVFIHF